MSAPRVVWLNGPFGAGKTTTARLLTGARGDRVLLDPELVGGFLVHHLGPVDDFQDLRAWRTLVADVVVALAGETSAVLVCPMSLLREAYAREIWQRVDAAGVAQRHVVLDASRAVLERRIEEDADEPSARRWRLDHLTAWESARPWVVAAADLVVDTDRRTVTEVRDLVEALLADGRPGVG